MKTYQFLVTYTNDLRRVEVKASSEKDALGIVLNRAKKALMKIISIELENTI